MRPYQLLDLTHVQLLLALFDLLLSDHLEFTLFYNVNHSNWISLFVDDLVPLEVRDLERVVQFVLLDLVSSPVAQER